MTLNEIEQRLTALKSEQDKLTAELEQLKAEQAEVKPWRAEYKSAYYYVKETGMIGNHHEEHDEVDNSNFRIGNYYRTRELAEQDAKELALRGRIRQLRDALCEGCQYKFYEKNWGVFLTPNNKFSVFSQTTTKALGAIYFDTREHAQTACDILNAEMRERNKQFDC